MAKNQNNAREHRISMEIVVDAHDPEERATGWYDYLEESLHFPFIAHCNGARAISPLQKGDEVEVINMAPSDECGHEMFVMIRYERRAGLGVPLSQLKPGGDADQTTRKAVEDWRYWVKMGYEF